MIKKISAFLFLIVSILGTLFFDASLKSIGGVNYRYLPFRVQEISCGSSFKAYSTCTHPYFLWGIVASIVFWIIIFIITYLIGRRAKR
jgi:hypothetical protein